jgi:hypothetical protein
MTSFHQFNALAASRGEGLHPKLRGLLEGAVACPLSQVSVRDDGLLQAGPNPGSEMDVPHANVTVLSREAARPATAAHELDAQKLQRQGR